MKVKVVLNPYANRWKAQDRSAAIESALREAGLDFDLVASSNAASCTDLAAEAVGKGYDAVVAAGGDGTLNEVLNGVLQASGGDAELPIGILPLGTANDFASMAGVPLTLPEAAEALARGHVRRIDAGRVNDRYFLNNSAAAMEPMVTLESYKLRRLSGESRYLVALVKALIKLKAWQMKLEWDDGHFEGPAILLSVCNSPRTGGFTMAPGAELDDGLLDLVLVPEVPKITLLRLLVRLMQGQHVKDPLVTFVRTSKLKVHSHPGTPAHADGEVFNESAVDLEYEVLPKSVALLGTK